LNSIFSGQRKKKSDFLVFELSECEKSKASRLIFANKTTKNRVRGVKKERFSRIQEYTAERWKNKFSSVEI